MSYKCPVRCGEGPYAEEHGAVMHAINKNDEAHRHITDKRSAYDALPDGDNHNPEEGSNDSDNSDSDEVAGNPTFGNADPTADVSEPDPSSEPTCIECGGELFDFRQFDTGSYHTVNGTSVYVRGDYQCGNCAKWLVDE